MPCPRAWCPRAAARCSRTRRVRKSPSSRSSSWVRAHGIGTEQCLRDYAACGPSRLGPRSPNWWKPACCRRCGWRDGGGRHTSTARRVCPRKVHARALLSPFDSLVWQRDRVRALWDFDYRLEIYVPEINACAATSSPSCSVRASSVGLTSRPTAPLACSGSSASPGSRAAGESSDRAELDAELDLMAQWLALTQLLRDAEIRTSRRNNRSRTHFPRSRRSWVGAQRTSDGHRRRSRPRGREAGSRPHSAKPRRCSTTRNSRRCLTHREGDRPAHSESAVLDGREGVGQREAPAAVAAPRPRAELSGK